MDKIRFQEDAVKKLEKDYSVLQTSVSQLDAILQWIKFLQKHIDASEIAMRSIIFGTIVQWQEQHQQFHFEWKSMTDQERLAHQQKLLELGRINLKEIIENPEDIQKIDRLIDVTIKEYIDTLNQKRKEAEQLEGYR